MTVNLRNDEKVHMDTDSEPLNERFYSVQQIADKLNIHFRTVYNLIYTGQLPSIRVGRVYRISQDHLNAFCFQQEQADLFRR